MDEMLFLRHLTALANDCESRGDYVSAAHLHCVLDRILDGESQPATCQFDNPPIQNLQ